MRCIACDRILNDFESTRKSSVTKEYLDLCNRCFSETDIDAPAERADLEGTGEHWIPEQSDTSYVDEG